MNKVWTQILLFTLIPIVSLGIAMFWDFLATGVLPGLLKLLLAVYFIGGLALLFTEYRQTGKALLISGGIFICVAVAFFIVLMINYKG
jgi:drug/metabolite transporter superfamily protein YnfA